MKKRKYKVNQLKSKLEGNIILTKEEFYLLKLFGPYWHYSRKANKLIFYLEFLIEGINENLNLGTGETEHK